MVQANDLLSQPILQVAGASLTIGAVLRAILILVVALFATWAVKRITRRMQVRIGEESASAVYIGGQVVRYIVLFTGLAIAVSALGVDLSALSLFAGALGVGIGLGLQDVVKNFVCGVVLLFDRSIEVGDFIELEDGTNGAVTSIGARATGIVTNDNVTVLVPNASLLNGKLTNWTRNRATRRIHVPFHVALGANKDLVKQAALEAANAVPFTLPEVGRQKSQVWLVGFGDASLRFELVVWPSLEAVKRPGSMMAAYCWALDDALQKYGIEIPVPQQEVRFRGPLEGAALPGRDERTRPPSHEELGDSGNDAAIEIDTASKPRSNGA
ncbi:mechanosensitive ion channel family protein [Sphingobium sp. CR28]|uniref:mechanosensitive ion channel family protein n=1 Tax=Sphingobium sp. CR28 TaxID=3400272 RepID=UPI003FF0AABD